MHLSLKRGVEADCRRQPPAQVAARRQIEVTREGGAGLAPAAYILGVLGTLFQVGFSIVWLTTLVVMVSSAPFIR